MKSDLLLGSYADHLWDWDWLGRALGVHPSIRPADMDGWLHQRGELLMLQGKVTSSIPDASIPERDAVRWMGNVTVLVVHTDADHWCLNRPSRVLGYRYYKSHTNPWDGHAGYMRLTGISDEDTLRTISNLVCVWSTWAATRPVL